MEKTKKKWLTVLMTLVMAMMLPMLFATPAEAVTGTKVTTTSALQTAANNGGTYYLGDHLVSSCTSTVTIPADKTLTLDMNGYYIQAKHTGYVFDVKGTLILEQNDGRYYSYIARHSDYSNSSGLAPLIHVSSGGVLKIKQTGDGGNIRLQGNKMNQATGGGAIFDDGGTVYIYDKTYIENCSATDVGGAIYVKNGVLYFYGGTIQNCSTTKSGGAVFVKNSWMYMKGGLIQNCTAANWGGGIYLSDHGNLDMSGGTIQNCSSANNIGGGVYLNNDTSYANISGGTITGNKYQGKNCEIYRSSGNAYISGYLTLGSGGTIGTVTNSGTVTGITFDRQSGTGGTASVTATYNAAMPGATMPTRTGYTFAGYWDAASGGTQYYNANGTSTRNWNKIAAAVTLYARWTPNTYTVTLNRQNGVNGSASATATFAANMPNITPPTYEGFTFLGYFDAAAGGTKYYNANGTSAKAWDKAANTTLYAQWQTNNGINVGNQEQIIEAFKWAPTNNTAITVNMAANIDVYNTTNPAGIVARDGQNITLDLKGYTLRQTHASHSCIIKLEGNCTVHIKDSSAAQTGTITNINTTASCSAIWVNNTNGNFYLDSGTITGCRTDCWGGAVCVDYGHFYMTGGTISNCSSAQYAGAVSVKNGGSFAMSGGTIENCTAASDGGGVWLAGGTTGTMSGGVIQNCQAYTYGGGVNVAGTFTMSGGVIQNNRLTWSGANQGKGGGVWIGGTGTMTGGYIINNKLGRSKCPAGVGVGRNCTFNMQGGIIWGNTASDGYIGAVQQDDGSHYSKIGGLTDPDITLTLEEPLTPIVHITMNDNIDLTSSIVMNMKQTITLDLNGKTLTQTKTTHTDIFNFDGPTTLHIQDSVGGGTITRSEAAATVCGAYLHHSDAVLYLHSGTITNMNNQYWGSGVSVASGKFYMDGGTISNCRAGQYGGGVGCKGLFEMSGGTIKDCTSTTYGGGVSSEGTFNMIGGTITGCTSGTHSGGVFNGGTFNFSGGTITGCTAGTTGGGIDTNGVVNMTGGLIENCKAQQGGGVWIWYNGGVFNMTDATIKDCTATAYGGGVYVNYNKNNANQKAKFTMTRSTIKGCNASAATGGGVDNDGIFTMIDSVIQDCSVVGCGGGIYNYSTGVFTMSGDSAIKNCSASVYDTQWNGRGGAICNIGIFTMENGEITGCTTVNETPGAGGVEQTSGTFNLNGGILWGNKNSVTGEVNSLLQTGGTLNKTGGYIDPKTVITLDAKKGTGGTASVTAAYGDTSLPVITVPTRDYHTFNGFYDAVKGGNRYYDADGHDVSGLTFWNIPDETVTLYAQWGHEHSFGEWQTGDRISYRVCSGCGCVETKSITTETAAASDVVFDYDIEAFSGASAADDVEFKVEKRESASDEVKALKDHVIKETLNQTATVLDISAYVKDQKTQISTGCTVRVKVKIPDGYTDIRVYYIPDEVSSDDDIEEIEDVEIENGYACFDVTHFSDYAILGTIDERDVEYEYYPVTAPTTTQRGSYNKRSYYVNTAGEKHILNEGLLGADVSVSLTEWRLLTGSPERGGLMGRQGRIVDSVISPTEGRTVIGLTADQLATITGSLTVIARDGEKEFTVTVDCAYTCFYDGTAKVTTHGLTAPDGTPIAAFVIIDNDGTDNTDNTISGYGYYRLYHGDTESEDNFLLDALCLVK